jgi:hypothetical protein
LFYYIFANVLLVIFLVGEIGLFGGEQWGCFPAAQIFANVS